MQLGVVSVECEELFVRTLLDDTPIIDDANDVGMDDRREAVGNDDSRTALHEVIQGTLHKTLALGIEGRSGFVEDEDRGILVDGTGDREALALATGELTPTVPDIGIVASRHLIDELIGVRDLGSLTHLLEGSTLDTEGDILKDRSIEEDGLLIDGG